MTSTLNFGCPSSTQRQFFLARNKYIAFGGARGGGKSWAVRIKAVLLALNYPGIKIMLVRKTYPELQANHISPILELVGKFTSYNGSRKELSFSNGSVIFFRSCKADSELNKFQGIEFDVLFIDEATQFSEETFNRMKACLRGVNSFPKRIYLTCNPGGIGHKWVKRLFIDRAYNTGEKAEDYLFIKSCVSDNKALMESSSDYVKVLEALPPKLKKAWLHGDWNIFEGQFFDDFVIGDEEAQKSRRYTHVIQPFEIPEDYVIYRSFDFGYSKPFDCSWWAVDYEGRAYLILQLYGCTGLPNEGVRWEPEQIFREIHEIECSHRWLKGRKIIGVADPSIWDASRGDAIIAAADRNFVHFDRGDNSRIAGWMQCHSRLAFDSEGRPRVQFFNTCHHAIRTLPLLQFSMTRPEDLDSDGEDHFADSFRYFCMALCRLQAASYR